MKMGKLGIRRVDLLEKTPKMDFLVKIVNGFSHNCFRKQFYLKY